MIRTALLLASTLFFMPALEAAAQDRMPDLPATVEAPDFRPDEERADQAAPDPAPEADAATEEARDDRPARQETVLPETVAVPEARPADEAREDAEDADEPVPTARAAPVPSGPSQCIADLSRLGVDFVDEDPVADGGGCGISDPVTVSSLGGEVDLDPPALMNCETAAASARFMRDAVQPAARETFGTEVRSLRQSSGYVCRTRHGQSRMSEHALGNALDWASIGLADEREIAVQAYEKDSLEQRFLSRIREAACGPFKTVLGPGSDADHADHFHFDLAERRNGSAYCR